ncbi:alpha-L-arabinofuranosidase C-terminal domain-containing protein [Paenibacillus abyssi]|uniref:non-reducing end alpha-L-arabinofuranosidase n=1 Tax=Paenibacillus abyssi TaxID=1340531 RepID=A0A917D3A1_9BACL|nr:alpha-L-arabinofuranosidase C-terminal domain-containing protein [Paenibacillus abyssi]GGG08033.1 alpha-N-arabinofuranosidase [Paenibacillus abyssi]
MTSRSAKVTIHADRKLFPVSPTLYGLFFEEINHAGDGGLYAELIRNRSFEDTIVPDRCHVDGCTMHTPAGWTAPFEHSDPIPGWQLLEQAGTEARMQLDDSQPLNAANPLSLRVDIERTEGGRAAVCNTGFWGIPVQAGAKYGLSFYARKDNRFSGLLDITLEDSSGEAVHAAQSVSMTSDQWQKFELTLESKASNPEARLVISSGTPGTFWLELVSLFPEDTFRKRKNGLRPDLVGMLQGLAPTFLRFPGGCFVEGFSVETAYRWKKTIGELSERISHWTLWHYRTTNGLGYYEYLQMAEDMGLEMMFVVNCGLTCQGRPGELIPMDELDEWVQDMLDAIEYANGPVTSKWGALRAQHGHPEPFGLKYIEIGNENFGPEYNVRYKVFYDAVKAAYPEIITIWNTHWEVGTETKGLPVEIVDEHFYADNEFYQLYHDMYDHYDRSGPKIYVGEYAMIVNNKNGTLQGALSEAAFMTGMERNQDIVVMSSYAPLLANIHHTVWDPNLIYFDGTRKCGTPSYYVQKLFGENRGEFVVESRTESDQLPPLIHGGLGLGLSELGQVKEVRISSGSEIRLQLNQLSDQSPACSVFHNALWIGDPSWQQIEVTMNVKLDEHGLKLRFLDRHQSWEKQNYFLWELEPSGESRLVRIVGWSRVKLAADAKVSITPAEYQQLRIVVGREEVSCYLDGHLVHEHAFGTIPYLTSVTTLDETNNELTVKLVNPSASDIDTELDIHGTNMTEIAGEQLILTADEPEAYNTLDQPTRVVPISSPLHVDGRMYRVPAYAVAILKIKLG